jgi:predicted nucleic acid-binding protein
MPMAAAIADVRRLAEIYTVLEDGPEVTERVYELLLQAPTRGKQVHDANLAATMLVRGITRLLAFNGDDFRRFGSLIELVAP